LGSARAGAAAAIGNPDWDVSRMPGHELLSGQEKLLCSTLQLLPQHYLMIKERLIREVHATSFAFHLMCAKDCFSSVADLCFARAPSALR
jgi:hypothetical protein